MRNKLLEHLEMNDTGRRSPMPLKLPYSPAVIDSKIETQDVHLGIEYRIGLRWTNIVIVQHNDETGKRMVLQNNRQAIMRDLYGELQTPMCRLKEMVWENVHSQKERLEMINVIEKMQRYTNA